MSDYRKYWMGFNLVKGIGPVRLRALLNVFGDAKTAWQAEAPALRAAGLSAKLTQNLIAVRSQVNLDRILEKTAAKDIQVITWRDASYPQRLRLLDNAPPVLYMRGQMISADECAVAIVGTRRVTAYGRQVAMDIANLLARCGITIVSGLARGVDAIAHRAALQAGARTLAVLGSGVDVIYPAEHRGMAKEIIQQGALLSDYRPGTPPDSVNFPPRNRIIAGLSNLVVVVEAGKTSGALITARYANEQGREVFAVPGNITAPQSRGTNRLIQQGAQLLSHPNQVLEALNFERTIQQQAARKLLPASQDEETLLQLMRLEACHIDELCAKTNWPASKISAVLSMMELKGLVRSAGGMQYIAVHESSMEYRTKKNE